MKLGLDSNILVYAHIPALEAHGRVHRFLLERLRTPDLVFVLTPSILHEFVHIITDSRRFETPVAMTEASALARLYLGKSNVECVETDETAMVLALEWMDRYGLGRKRLADTIFAATLIRHGVRQIITCNRRDYQIFDELEVVDPCASSQG